MTHASKVTDIFERTYPWMSESPVSGSGSLLGFTIPADALENDDLGTLYNIDTGLWFGTWDDGSGCVEDIGDANLPVYTEDPDPLVDPPFSNLVANNFGVTGTGLGLAIIADSATARDNTCMRLCIKLTDHQTNPPEGDTFTYVAYREYQLTWNGTDEFTAAIPNLATGWDVTDDSILDVNYLALIDNDELQADVPAKTDYNTRCADAL